MSEGVTLSIFTKKFHSNVFIPAISPDGLLCQCREHRVWHGCRSTLGVDSGKHYFEATVTDEGLCRVGWSTARATLELGRWQRLIMNASNVMSLNGATLQGGVNPEHCVSLMEICYLSVYTLNTENVLWARLVPYGCMSKVI